MTKRTSPGPAQPEDVRDPGRDRDAYYVQFVETNWTQLRRMARLMAADEDRGDELLQDCLVKLYIRWRKTVEKGDPAAYLHRMLVNGSVDWWRRSRRERPTDSIPEHAAHAPAPGGLLDRDLLRALRELPKGQRAVVVLRYFEDMTERDTAAVLGCSIGTVKSQNARAMASLRVSLTTTDSFQERVPAE